jgi:catechol 2,3-dioxygenase-like lactoylglutathione lyase family enzyme
MIQKLSHATVWVLDQERAKTFYTEKLGFKVNTDVTMDGGFRWLTVNPPGQPDMEIVLMAIGAGGMMDEEAAAALRGLVEKGVMGAGAFETADCRKTYEELKARGVRFMGEPAERPYGIEAILQDDSGNWFSMTERPK